MPSAEKCMQFCEVKEEKIFNPLSIYSSTPFTQGYFYGEWQKSIGRKVKRFLVYSDKEVIAYLQMIKYPLLFNKSYFYIPYGPVVKNFSEKFFTNLKNELIRIAKNENAIFVRLDFTPFIPDDTLSKFFIQAPFYTYHSAHFQPRAEWFLELEKSEDELLRAMHKKARYNIKLSERQGVTVEIVTGGFEKYFDAFYELMTETAKRNDFSLHYKNYYKNIFQNLHKVKNSYLAVARYDQKILVINLIIVYGKIANYVFGGSSSEEKNRMPTYLAQWKAICYAQQLNCTHYNFGGISIGSKIYKGWDGLTMFKKKFGGKEIIHSDFFDIVISPLWYYLYNFRKRLKKFGI